MRLPFRLLIITLPFVLGGCATEEMKPIPIAGGRVIGIPFGPGGPRSGKADGYEVRQAMIMPGTQDRQVIYQFAFTSPPAASLRRVQVDDISEDQSSPLIDDGKPWVTDNLWHSNTTPIDASDPRLVWVYTVTPSVRVYRFIITDATGRRTVLYQVAIFPDHFKSAIRHKWGEKY